MGRVFVCVRIVSQKPGANICPWTNTISKTWGKYSSMDEYLLETLGEYSSMDEYFLENMGQIFVRGRIVSLGNVGRILVFVRGRVLFRKHGRIFVRGRIVSRKRGANIRSWTNATFMSHHTYGLLQRKQYGSHNFLFSCPRSPFTGEKN